MDIKFYHWISILIATAVMIGGYFLLPAKVYPLVAGIAALFGALPFIISMMNDVRIANEKEEMFL